MNKAMPFAEIPVVVTSVPLAQEVHLIEQTHEQFIHSVLAAVVITPIVSILRGLTSYNLDSVFRC